jgi:hypothetical protein
MKMCARWRSILSTLACANIASTLVLPLQKLPESTIAGAGAHLNHCEDAPVIRSDVPTPTDPSMAESTRMRDTTHQTVSVVATNPAGWAPVSLHMASQRSESPCGKVLVILMTLIVSSRVGRVMVVESRARTTPRVTIANRSATAIALRLALKIHTEDQNTLARSQDVVKMVDTVLGNHTLSPLEVHDTPTIRYKFVILAPEPDTCNDTQQLARDIKAAQEVRVLL